MFKLKNIHEHINEMAMAYKPLEYVDYSQISLKKEYDKLNKVLFDNSLPDIPLKWDKRKGAAGHVRSVKFRSGTKSIIKHLSMSVFYKATYREFLDTLAHEMIHVHNIHNGLDTKMFDPHGVHFIKEMDRINALGHGFKISITKDSSNLRVSDSIKMKKPLIALLFTAFNKRNIIVMSEKTFYNEHEGLNRFFNKWVQNGKTDELKAMYIKSFNPELKREKVQRSFARKISWRMCPIDLWESIRDTGEILKEISIDRDSVPSKGEVEATKNATASGLSSEEMKKIRRKLRRQYRKGIITWEQYREQLIAAGFNPKNIPV